MKTKICTECGEDKLLSAFYKRKGDKYVAACRGCAAKHAREKRVKQKKQYRTMTDQELYEHNGGIKTKRKCGHCGKNKSLKNYSRNYCGPGGLHSCCKQCEAQRVGAYYHQRVTRNRKRQETQSAQKKTNQNTVKTCRRCGEDKPASEYHVSILYDDGLNVICKKCIQDEDRRHYERKSFSPDTKYNICDGCGRKLKREQQMYCQACADAVEPAEWAPETAYLVGAMGSDGNLERGNRRMSIELTSASFMEAAVQAFQTKLEPKPRTYQQHFAGYDQPVTTKTLLLKINSPRHRKLFEQVGLTPAKTHNMRGIELPRRRDGITPHFWLFLRGFFDGDGTINSPEKEITPRMSIIGGDREFFVKLRLEVVRHLITAGVERVEAELKTLISIRQEKPRVFKIGFSAKLFTTMYEQMYAHYEEAWLPDRHDPSKKVYWKELGCEHKIARMRAWYKKRTQAE